MNLKCAMFVPNYFFLSALVFYKARYAYFQMRRSNCRRAGIFSDEHQDQLLVYKKNDLQSRIVNSMKVPSLLTCSGKCTSIEACRSFNFKKLGTGMNCHILDFDGSNANAELQSEIGWYHYEPVSEASVCHSVKCQPGYHCVESCKNANGFQCVENEPLPLFNEFGGIAEVRPRDNGYFQFKVGVPSGIYKINIVHQSGYFTCSTLNDTSTFGCFLPGIYDDIWIVLTSDTSEDVLLPGPKGITLESGVRPSNTSFVIYNDLIQLSEGQNMRFWNKEDFDNSTGPEWDNGGAVKFHAYATKH